MSAREKKDQISVFLEWARQRLIKNAARYSEKPRRHYKDGDVLCIGNESYKLMINYKEKKTSSAKIMEDTIILSLAAGLTEKEKATIIPTLLSRCIGKKRLPGLSRKIGALNNKYFKKKVGRVFFKYNKSSWGSCSTKGNINISTRLLFAPDDVLEYVCIHELAHLIEHNHSKRYWDLVKKIIPDYKEKEKWLKDNQDKCWF